MSLAGHPGFLSTCGKNNVLIHDTGKKANAHQNSEKPWTPHAPEILVLNICTVLCKKGYQYVMYMCVSCV